MLLLAIRFTNSIGVKSRISESCERIPNLASACAFETDDFFEALNDECYIVERVAESVVRRHVGLSEPPKDPPRLAVGYLR